MKSYVFAEPLLEGVILSRRGSVALTAELRGAPVFCRFPARGRLSGVRLDGRPCLLSRSDSPRRRTQYTAEAFSLQEPGEEKKRWIGLNRLAVRDYAAHYLPRREFAPMLQTGEPAVPGGYAAGMRTDFRMGDTYLKLQAPMQELNLPLPPGVRAEPRGTAAFGIRMARQLRGAAERMEKRERLLLLLCYLYNSPPTVLCGRKNPAYGPVRDALEFMRLRGIEIWQANFRVEPERVWLIRLFPIRPENTDGTGVEALG